jgi:hypothetical protein
LVGIPERVPPLGFVTKDMLDRLASRGHREGGHQAREAVRVPPVVPHSLLQELSV